MLLPSVRRLALADVTEDVLRELAKHGESIHIERKEAMPKPPRLGAAAASFANLLGGFILLGIADDGTPVGWTKPGKLDLQSYLGELLRLQVDPLPPFVADMRELDGKPIAVLRVFESADRPHIVRGTGAIYVRTSKGKEPVPVDDHATVLEMARRGEEAASAARARLRETPAVQLTFRAPDSGIPRVTEGIEFIARAAPLTVTPALSEWALTRAAADTCQRVAGELLPQAALNGLMFARNEQLLPYGRAIAAEVAQTGLSSSEDRVTVLADSNGVVAASLLRGRDGSDPAYLLIQAMLKDELVPLARCIAGVLHDAEAFGRAAVDLWLVSGQDEQISGQQREIRKEIHVARELVIPADEEEVLELAAQWHRELQREIGIVKYEGE